MEGEAMNWYDVRIEGNLDGKPMVLEGTVEAGSVEGATLEVLAREWDDIWRGAWLYGWPDPRYYSFLPNVSGDNASILLTRHRGLDQMATLITDPVRLAELDGSPSLTGEME